VLSFVGTAAQFAPGARFEYTNTNYVVLGGILEALTGAGVEGDFQASVAAPANMPRLTFAAVARASRSAYAGAPSCPPG
jgi:CubicO group peptidase (beta-lactamase class C family)